MEVSAFGVVHKSFRKLEPKLLKAEKSLPEYNDQNFLQRMKFNSVHLRRVAGKYPSDIPVRAAKDVGGAWKKLAEASVRGHEKNIKRKGRVLP